MQSYLLTLTLAFGFEYCLKQWWETLASQAVRPKFGYLLFRLAHVVLLAVTGYLLSAGRPLIDWFLLALVFVILGSLEWPLRVIITKIHKTTGVYLYQLNYLIPLFILYFNGLIGGFVPRYNANYGLIFLFVFLAHPANYFIRWALKRDEPDLKNQNTQDRLEHKTEVAATGMGAPVEQDPSDQRAKVGRRIGTIERWLIVLLT